MKRLVTTEQVSAERWKGVVKDLSAAYMSLQRANIAMRGMGFHASADFILELQNIVAVRRVAAVEQLEKAEKAVVV